MRRIHINAALIAALAALLMLTGCGRGKQEAEPTPPPVLRTPIPTFTPTVSTSSDAAVQSAPADTASVAETAPQDMAAVQPSTSANAESTERGVGGPLEPPAVVAPIQVALGVINTELVNSRGGPDTTFNVVTILGAGESFDITGKSADGSWLRLCCMNQQEAWVKADFVTVSGSLDALPVAQGGETSGQTVARSAAAAQATVAAAAPAAAAEQPTVEAQVASVEAAAEGPAAVAESAPAESASTEVANDATVQVASAAASSEGLLQLAGQEQFPETNVVRIFLFVYQGTDALEGYTLRVVKDGVEQTADGTSFGGRPGMTWPIADDRQRFQNLKVEFPGVDAAGVWEVTAMKDGAPAGPSATFTLSAGDPNQELYVRYMLP